jgi:hypothetical protein
MKSIKSAVPVCVALAVGFASGAYLSRPPKVKASTSFHIQKLRTSAYGDSSNLVLYDDYVGFSCTAQDCYILTR